MRVIISVPHGFCPVSITRACDKRAKLFADTIRAGIESAGIEVDFFVADRPRSEVDSNRREGRETGFRKKLDERLSERECDDILLDIHSATPDALTDFPSRKIVPFEAYLLEMGGFPEDDAFNHALYDYLKERGVDVHLRHGTNENDIVVRAIEEFCIHRTSLVEINESTPEKRIKEIASMVVGFVRGIASGR